MKRPSTDGRPPSVIIMGDLFGFPHFAGSGATTRVRAYAAGLHDSGARVKVLCVEPSEDRAAAVNTEVRGTVAGVDFEYTYGLTFRPAPGTGRRLRKFTKYVRFMIAVWGWAAEGDGLDAIIVYSRRTLWISAARVACWSTGAVLVHEDVERPFVWHRHGILILARRWIYEHAVFKAFDGCLAISTYLRDYCAAHLRPGAEAIVVPILVDVDEFTAVGEGHNLVDDRVVYCGSLSHPQSLSVVEAFGAIAGEFPGLRLQLIGGAHRPGAEGELRALAGRLEVADRVDFTGKVPREDLVRLLCTARLLILPRPKGAAAEFAAAAALPTKVGEYLAAGRPVVVAAAGDLPLYLTDGVDAFLVPPADTPAFVERLRYALTHPEEAEAVGRRGRETARRSFDPAVHGARILAFIEELQRRGTGKPRRGRWTGPRVPRP